MKCDAIKAHPPIRAVLLLLLLVTAGLAGNFFRYPIFLNIDFLFGSIFAMLTLQIFGWGRAVQAAILIASVTYLLWNHPYAIVIMTLEVACVGWLMRRHAIGLVLADGLFWLFAGMPLVYACYHGIMGVPLENTTIVMTKQAVNGIANALTARLLFTGYVLGTRTGQVTYRDLVYNLLAFFSLYPALLLLMLASHAEFLEADRTIRIELQRNTRVMNNHIAFWLRNRSTAVTQLAKMAETMSAAEMQSRLAQAHAADDNFQRMSLLDKDAVIRAFSPSVDELGQSNIGASHADLRFIPILKQTLKPTLSEVVVGRIGHPMPVVSVLAPIVIDGRFAGAISGSLSLNQLSEHLQANIEDDGSIYTLLDRSANVILTNRKSQEVMKAIERGQGSLNPVGQGMALWLPHVPANTPISEQWRMSFYVTETQVGNFAEWHLVLEQPVAPFQRVLYARYTNQLALLLLALLSALALAEIISRRISARTEQIIAFARQLPIDLGRGVQPVWPKSNFTEHAQLMERFKLMAGSLAAQFAANRQLTGTLEDRVARRTVALANSEEKYRLLIDNSHDIIYALDKDGVFTFVSKAWTALLGHPLSEVVGHSCVPFVHPDDLTLCMTALEEVFEAGQEQHNIEYRVLHANGAWRWHHSNAVPVRDVAGKVVGYEGIASDITERKRMEGQVHQMAFFDALTKLPNRHLLSDRMRQAMASSKRSLCYGALMFLDLDNFKPLNDKHGHAVGDLRLIEVAIRLIGCVRAIDTVVRFGGDEFVVMLGDLDRDKVESTLQARAVAEKIRVSLAQPYLLNVTQFGSPDRVIEHHSSVCIGVVVFVNHEVYPEDVLRWADSAMYEAKRMGRNSIQFHQDDGAPSDLPSA